MNLKHYNSQNNFEIEKLEDELHIFGSDQERMRAFSFFKGLSQQNEDKDGFIQCWLGYCYFYGLGVKIDTKKAFDFFEKSASKDNSFGLRHLAKCYDFCVGIISDKKKSLVYYKQSANYGNHVAQTALGWLYKEERGKIKKAIHYYVLSAEQGYEIAQKALEMIKHKGYESQIDKEISKVRISKNLDKNFSWISCHKMAIPLLKLKVQTFLLLSLRTTTFICKIPKDILIFHLFQQIFHIH